MDTRKAILEKNFEAISKIGFQGVRTDKVILELGITKGAFYHYFPDKYAMGYAVVDEIIYPMYVNTWLEAQNSNLHPVDAIIEGIRKVKSYTNSQNICMGCSLNNLIQEMSAIDEDFRKKLANIIDTQLKIIQKIIAKGIENQQIIDTTDPVSLSNFIVASIEGSYAIGKVKQSIEAFLASIRQLIQYLNSLKT